MAQIKSSAPTRWATGRYPSVSVKSYGDLTVAVCAYDFTFSNGINCCVGAIDKITGFTEWGAPTVCCYRGWRPSVSLFCANEKLYVFEANSFFWTESFLYRIGEVDVNSKTVAWGSPDIIGGVNPKVSATDGGTVMAVAVRGRQSKTMHLHRGTVDTHTKKVAWTAILEIPDFRGVEPDISINASKIVIVCRSVDDTIQFKIGRMNEEDIWVSSHLSVNNNFVYGRNPSISLNSDGVIMEVHQSRALRKLSRHCGHARDDNSISWSESKTQDPGEFPSISLCEDGFFYEVHKTNFGIHLYTMPGQLIFNVSCVIFFM